MKFRLTWKRAGIAILTAFAIYVIAGILLSGRDIPAPPGSVPVTMGNGQVTAHHMKTKSWELSYDRAQTSPDGALAEIDGIHNGILYRKGKPYMRISAVHVSANTMSDDFTATGKVSIEELGAKEKRSFETDLVQWINLTHTLTLPHISVVRTGKDVLTIKSATVNFQTGQIHVTGISGKLHA